jgi:flavin reductase (DIM6/NTAB) family NADH-FMN oxidoreductase RutF
MFYATHEPHGLKYNPFKALIVPRPIGWISTLNASGRVNLAPFSFFNGVADQPPIVVIGCVGMHADGGLKDTLVNIEGSGEFVANVVTWALRDQMNQTAAAVSRDTDEMRLAGLTPAPSRIIKTPRVAESPVALECRHIQTVDLPSTRPIPNRAVFGHVVGIYIDDSIIKDGIIDMGVFRPVARMGYHDYTVVRDVFTITKPPGVDPLVANPDYVNPEASSTT